MRYYITVFYLVVILKIKRSATTNNCYLNVTNAFSSQVLHVSLSVTFSFNVLYGMGAYTFILYTSYVCVNGVHL